MLIGLIVSVGLWLVPISTQILQEPVSSTTTASKTTVVSTSTHAQVIPAKTASTSKQSPPPKTTAVIPTQKPIETSVVVVPPLIPNQPVTDTSPTPSWDEINESARKATVNILCTSASGGLLSPLSASGVIIDPQGVILTNAHVAQYFLIKDYPIKGFLECVIRQDSPAKPLYHADLLYISPTWVTEHYEEMLEQTPTGTGERDFALLIIRDGVGPTIQLPQNFPYLPISLIDSPTIVGHPVILSAYPAGFLGGILIQTNLYLSSAPATIQDVFTFGDTTVDLVSLGGSVVAQHGSSGGPVVTSDGKVLGIVVTSSEAQSTGGRNLDAITLSYINRSFTEEIKIDLPTFLKNNLKNTAAAFSTDVAPALTKLYTELFQKSGR